MKLTQSSLESFNTPEEDTGTAVAPIDYTVTESTKTSPKNISRIVLATGGAALLIVPWIIVMLRLGQYVNPADLPWWLVCAIALECLAASTFFYRNKPSVIRIIGVAFVLWVVIMALLFLLTTLMQ